MRKLDTVFVPLDGPLSRVNNFVGIVRTISLLLWLSDRSHSDAHKSSARFRLFVSQAGIVGSKLLDGPCDGVVILRIVLLIPLPEILMPLILQARSDSRPVESRPLIGPMLRIRQHQFSSNHA